MNLSNTLDYTQQHLSLLKECLIDAHRHPKCSTTTRTSANANTSTARLTVNEVLQSLQEQLQSSSILSREIQELLTPDVVLSLLEYICKAVYHTNTNSTNATTAIPTNEDAKCCEELLTELFPILLSLFYVDDVATISKVHDILQSFAIKSSQGSTLLFDAVTELFECKDYFKDFASTGSNSSAAAAPPPFSILSTPLPIRPTYDSASMFYLRFLTLLRDVAVANEQTLKLFEDAEILPEMFSFISTQHDDILLVVNVCEIIEGFIAKAKFMTEETATEIVRQCVLATGSGHESDSNGSSVRPLHSMFRDCILRIIEKLAGISSKFRLTRWFKNLQMVGFLKDCIKVSPYDSENTLISAVTCVAAIMSSSYEGLMFLSSPPHELSERLCELVFSTSELMQISCVHSAAQIFGAKQYEIVEETKDERKEDFLTEVDERKIHIFQSMSSNRNYSTVVGLQRLCKVPFDETRFAALGLVAASVGLRLGLAEFMKQEDWFDWAVDRRTEKSAEGLRLKLDIVKAIANHPDFRTLLSQSNQQTAQLYVQRDAVWVTRESRVFDPLTDRM